MAGAAVARGLTLIASVLVARVLGSATFGALGMIQSTAAIFQIFAGFGLGLTASKYVAEFKLRDPSKAGRILALSTMVAWATGVLSALALAAWAPWLATHTLGHPSLSSELRVGAILVALSAINGAQTGAMSGFEAFKQIAFTSTVAGLASFPVLVLGAYLWGLHGAVWGLLAGPAVNAILNSIALRQLARAAHVPLILSGWRNEWRVLFSYSLPAVLAGLVVAPATWASNLFLINYGGGYSAMGVFNAATQWRTAILFIPSTLASVAIPALARLQGAADTLRFRKLLWWNVGLNFAISVGVAGTVVLISPVIATGYGAGYYGLRLTLILLCASAVVTATTGAAAQVLASTGRMWCGFGLTCIWALSLLAGSWSFRHRGAVGLAWATLLSYGLYGVTVGLAVWLILRRLQLRHQHSLPGAALPPATRPDHQGLAL